MGRQLITIGGKRFVRLLSLRQIIDLLISLCLPSRHTVAGRAGASADLQILHVRRVQAQQTCSTLTFNNLAVLGADGPADVGFLGIGADKSEFSGEVRGFFGT